MFIFLTKNDTKLMRAEAPHNHNIFFNLTDGEIRKKIRRNYKDKWVRQAGGSMKQILLPNWFYYYKFTPHARGKCGEFCTIFKGIVK